MGNSVSKALLKVGAIGCGWRDGYRLLVLMVSTGQIALRSGATTAKYCTS